MAFSTPSLACWDDDDDDWYDYYYDWLDDDSSLYGDYDPNSYWLDEVEVTYEQPYDWGLDEDWWRTDDEAFDDYDDGYDDYDDYYDNNDDNYYENHNVGYGNEDEENQDETATPPPYFKQECHLCCVPAVMAIINMVMDGMTLEQAQEKYNEYVDKFQKWTGKEVSDDGIKSDEVRDFFDKCDFETRKCSPESIEMCVNEYGLNVFVYIDVFDDNGNKYGHALDVIGAYKDENGETIYTCVNPNTGRVEDHNKSDFTNPTATFAVIKTHK